MKKNIVSYIVLFFMLIACNGFASPSSSTDDDEAKNNSSSTAETTHPLISEKAGATERTGEIKQNQHLHFLGYIDGAYSYMERSEKFVSGTDYIANDLNTNGFALHQLAATLVYAPPEGMGAVFTGMVGQDAIDIASLGTGGEFGDSEIGYTVFNAYGQYASRKFTFLAGLMQPLVGYESYDPTDARNTNFSRSALFTAAEPGTVMGVRGVYAFNKQVNFSLGVNNGWSGTEDLSRAKTVSSSLVYTPNTLFSITFAGMTGEERAKLNSTTGPIGQRTALNSYATINITKKLSLVGNYDYGIQTQAELPDKTLNEATWQGFSGYINYQFNNKWVTSIRGEIFDDDEGYLTGVKQVWTEATFTLGYFVNEHIEFRAEARYDFSNANAFKDIDSTQTADNQTMYALQAYYKYWNFNLW